MSMYIVHQTRYTADWRVRKPATQTCPHDITGKPLDQQLLAGCPHHRDILSPPPINMAQPPPRLALFPKRGLGPLFILLLVVLLLAQPVAAADGQTGDPDYTCSATKPCALGCCGKNGVCGMGPDYCSAANCINSCNAKSECDPANWGPQYAANTKCPLNVSPTPPAALPLNHRLTSTQVCCSKFGFCGTTPEFCGTTQIANPSCPGGKSAVRRTIGYYEGWGVGRACDAMLPEQVPASAYTHLNFAFAMIDPVSFAVAPMSDGDVPLYSRLTGLKALYPNLKVSLGVSWQISLIPFLTLSRSGSRSAGGP